MTVRKTAFALAALLALGYPLPSRAADAGTFIRMKEVEIMGVVEHPEITYIIPKTRILFKPLPLDRDFSRLTGRLLDPAGIEEEIRLRKLASGAGAP